MDFALLAWLKDFDFAAYFNITTHSMELKNTLWKKEILLRDLEEGLRHIKCSISTCTKNSAWINIIDKTSYCDTHVKKIEYSDDNFVKIERIVDDFRFRLVKMEKYLVFIQERNHHFAAPNVEELLSEKSIDELKEINKLLERKIKEFHERVERLKKNKSLDLYFETKDSYDQIKTTIFDIFKMISKLEEELRIDSLLKVVEEDLGIKFKGKEPKEERKEKKNNDELLDIYDKKIDFLNPDYISSKKVDELKANMLKVCNWAEEYYNLNRVNEVKLEKLRAENDSLYEEYKGYLSQLENPEKIQELKTFVDKAINEITETIEMILSKKKETTELSSLLKNVLDNIGVFNSKIHFKLMDALEDELKKLCDKDGKGMLNKLFKWGAKKTRAKQELKESIIDFLYLLKDNHPFSNPREQCNLDVFYRVMEFMRDNNLKPSKKLIKIYEQSETTRKLNQIPSFNYLNKNIKMKNKIYDKMIKRYQSKPSFVYFFNPNSEIQTKTAKLYGLKFIQIGYFEKGTESLVGTGMRIFEHGGFDQGYYKNNKLEYFGRYFHSNGDFYIGGYRQDNRHGEGEYVWEEGWREVGTYVDGKNEGKAKFYDKAGKEYDRVYKGGVKQ